MARTGYKVTVYLDDNPDSPTYGQTYEERVYDTEHCPIEEDDLVLVGNECEIGMSGYTGYRLMTYYNRTTGEYVSVREEDAECEPSSTEEQWVNSGSPFCETTEQGLNTGYMLQLQVQMNQALPSYGTTRYSRYKSPDCALNSCASWDDIQSQCHISVSNCVATFDGTEDVTQIDVNPLSETYNTTRTINREDTGDCQNCTETTFSWVEVGEMCGDNGMLCAEGITENPTSKYLVERKYKTIGSSEPVAMGEYRLTLVEEDVEDCGYIPPQYKWEVAQGQFLCDYETYTKYQMEVRWVSYDSGVTWSVDTSTEPRRGAVIAEESYDCGKPMYRWVPTDDYVCMFNGDDFKLKITSSSGNPFVVECNSGTSLSQDDIGYNPTPSFTSATLMEFGDCVEKIEASFGDIGNYNQYTEIQFGDYIEEIDITYQWSYYLFGRYSHVLFKEDTFKERMRKIAPNTFNQGTIHYENDELHLPASIESLGAHSIPSPNVTFIDAVVPPTITEDKHGSTAEPIGSPKAVFVPRGSVGAYRRDSGWTAYSGMIYSIAEEDVFYRPTYSGGVQGYAISAEENTELTSGMTQIPYRGLQYSSITSVHIGNSVRSIGTNAFYRCSGLTSVTIPSGVTSIGDKAFYWCMGLTSVTIPDSVTSIGSYAFGSCSSLTSVTIGSGVTSIGNDAFYACSSLSSITIPDSVTSIGSFAFYNCSSLTSVTIGSGVTSIGNDAFYNCSSLTSVTIPNSVTGIGSSAFANCTSLTSVTIGNSVKRIFQRAFYNCSSLTSVTIPNSVTSIDDNAFYGCSSLTNVTIPNSVTSIGQYAFYNCSSLTSVTIGSGVTSIGNYVFQNCTGLRSITIPDSVTSIEQGAFYNCSGLTSITIPDSVTSIGNNAFQNCSGLTSVIIGSGVTSIGDSAFSSCYVISGNFINNSSLDEVTNNYWGATIYDSETDGLLLKNNVVIKYRGTPDSVTIPDSVTGIGSSAFNSCSSLTSVTIGSGVTTIGSGAFSYCTGLTGVTVNATTPPTLGLSSVFDNTNNCPIYVPSGSVQTYKTTVRWNTYRKRIQAIPNQ